jgi:hypothetical protein
MNPIRVILLVLASSICAFAQEVKRPPVPDAKTLASSSSQIAAWYRYATQQEATVAARESEIAALKAAASNSGSVSVKLDAIVVQLGAIADKLATLNTPAPKPPNPPVINPPSPGEARIGSTVTLEASAEGTEPITWQWAKNGSPVDVWTTAKIVLPSVTTNDTADYTATATNSAGSATSSAFSLKIIP